VVIFFSFECRPYYDQIYNCNLEISPTQAIGRAHTTEENGKWGKTKQRSENQVAFNRVLGPS
jgi:hypothetical protein